MIRLLEASHGIKGFFAAAWHTFRGPSQKIIDDIHNRGIPQIAPRLGCCASTLP